MNAAIRSFFAGMELQNIVQKKRQEFEMRLQTVAGEHNRLSRSSDSD